MRIGSWSEEKRRSRPFGMRSVGYAKDYGFADNQEKLDDGAEQACHIIFMIGTLGSRNKVWKYKQGNRARAHGEPKRKGKKGF